MEISVLMSTYNETARYLVQAIQSILNQTYDFKELIVVLDNPKRQDLRDVLIDFAEQDDRVKPIFNRKNMGLASSLNRAASNASGDFLARMDSDDIAYPERLSVEVEQLERRNLDVISANVVYIDEDGNQIGKKGAVPENPKTIAKTLFLASTIIHPTVIMRKHIFEAVGGYRLLPTAEDYDLWLRMIDAGARIGAVSQPLLEYRIRNDSMTSNAWRTYVVSAYIRFLCRQRRHQKSDEFSIEQMKRAFMIAGLDDKQAAVRFNEGQRHFEATIDALKHHQVASAIRQLLKCVTTSKENRKSVRRYFHLRFLLAVFGRLYGKD